MRSTYFAIVGALVVAAASLFVWKNRKNLPSVSDMKSKAKGTARSVWGSVHNAAENIARTEREPQPIVNS